MKKLLQILITSSFILGASLASANGAHRSLPRENKLTKSEQTGKSNKRKSRSSKRDQQILDESRSEGGSLSTQAEIDEIREGLGEK